MNIIKTVYNQELQNTFHLIKFIDEIKQKRFRCAEQASQIIKLNAHRILVRMSKEKDELEDLGIDGKIKKKCTLVYALRLCTGRMAHRGCRGRALLFLDHGIRRG